MLKKSLLGSAGVAAVFLIAWLGQAQAPKTAKPEWSEISPGVWRIGFPKSEPGQPNEFAAAGYALVEGGEALLVDVPFDAAGLNAKVVGVLLTSYHRDRWAGRASVPADVLVRAPVKADEFLEPKKVAKFWKDSIPLRSSRTGYFVGPTGISADFDLKDGASIEWKGRTIRVRETPGHARAQASFIVSAGPNKPRIAFCGDAFASPGKIWAPFATDWDHWTDAGLKPTAESLKKLIDEAPDILCPAHGPVLSKPRPVEALRKTLAAVEEAGFLKSFERFTKGRLGNPPQYAFLAKEQAESNGSKPWSKVSDHLYLTGNTYVLTSKTGACLMFDPWDKRSFDQFAKLKAEKNLGPIEVVMFSHAHFDHYDGVYHFDRATFEVWSLDTVARPIADPFVRKAPFLDARKVRFDKTPKNGDSLAWHEYLFRFHDFPGQSEFTMAVETTIDGRRCLFTADNFFHQDMFSGSGGWMGMNRSFPPLYAASAKKVLDIRPDWVLAEHGGPFEFNAEDFERRAKWGEAAARALDALSPSGSHRHDWNPHRVAVEPFVQKAKAGAKVRAEIVVDQTFARNDAAKGRLILRGPGPMFREQAFEVQAHRKMPSRTPFEIDIPVGASTGQRLIFTIDALDPTFAGADCVFAIDVE